MEDKQKICDALLETLKLTYSFDDITSIVFEEDSNGDDDMVAVTFENGTTQRVYVGLDNGFAMVKDILRKIGG